MIYCREARCFTDEDVGLAGAIATLLAQAIARRKAEEETRAARASAEDAARARAEMLAVVAHDLRNPLGVAQLKAQLMQRRLPDGDLGAQMKKDLETIFRNTQHMARLIGDLLDAASIEARRMVVEKSPSALVEIVGESIDLVRPLAEERRLVLTAEVEPTSLTVSCDRGRIVQVLSNLVGNAVKFTPSGGVVLVSVRSHESSVLVTVDDTGPGIPEEDRERVFERYVHGPRKGSVGLGLFISRGLVAAHGGRIWIERASPAGGTRVCFSLPTE
jgi:signal transduction histidine kinase